MQSVQFISNEDDGTDQIVAFALDHGEMAIRSLILMRTPQFEPLLDETERGVSVSLEDGSGKHGDLLEVIRIGPNRVKIETQSSKFDLNIRRVDPEEVSEMKALIERMNFDNRFRIEKV
jgi:hypothetical protein